MIESPIILAGIAILCSSLAGFLIWVAANLMKRAYSAHHSFDDHAMIIAILEGFLSIITAFCFLLFAVIACSMMIYQNGTVPPSAPANGKVVPSMTLPTDEEGPSLE